MKKIILTVAAVFAIGFANAQDKKEAKSGFGFSQGDVLLEGNLSFDSSKTDNGSTVNKTNDFGLTPKVGYFIDSNFAVGVQLGVGSNKTTSTTGAVSTETKTNSFGAGVFGRYYFLNLGERFKTYSELDLGFGNSKNSTNGNENYKDSNFNAGVTIGMNYFVTKSFAINFGLNNVLGFNSGKRKYPTPGTADDKTTSFSGNLNLFNNFFSATSFGLTYKF